MKDFLHKNTVSGERVIYFLYHDEKRPLPTSWSDPLELLGDISQLTLTGEQLTELRSILTEELTTEGAEAIWRGRAFRKNLIHSFGVVM